uniref:Defensin-like protein n=1 Tax=Panagrellus redivivus TaxID=6233 RepID=A0A7E4V9X3_PANRE
MWKYFARNSPICGNKGYESAPFGIGTMIKVYILLAVLFLWASFGYASFECSVYGSLGKQAHCGKNGCLIGYGEKYCRRFKRKPPFEKPDRCGKIKFQAFESHVGCYVNCGFCGIVVANMGALKNTYDFGDLFSIEAWQQIVAVVNKCTG